MDVRMEYHPGFTLGFAPLAFGTIGQSEEPTSRLAHLQTPPGVFNKWDFPTIIYF